MCFCVKRPEERWTRLWGVGLGGAPRWWAPRSDRNAAEFSGPPSPVSSSGSSSLSSILDLDPFFTDVPPPLDFGDQRVRHAVREARRDAGLERGDLISFEPLFEGRAPPPLV